MIHAALSDWRKYPGLVKHPVWQAAFQWLEACAEQQADGIYPLGQDGFYARVMSYALKERDVARYENHRHTIDIQYTLNGAERIELSPENMLERLDDYACAKDTEHYKTPAGFDAVVTNSKGLFTIIFPGEPHMPQLMVPGADAVKKVVVKIPAGLVG